VTPVILFFGGELEGFGGGRHPSPMLVIYKAITPPQKGIMCQSHRSKYFPIICAGILRPPFLQDAEGFIGGSEDWILKAAPRP
jgi:hypothetical protein